MKCNCSKPSRPSRPVSRPTTSRPRPKLWRASCNIRLIGDVHEPPPGHVQNEIANDNFYHNFRSRCRDNFRVCKRLDFWPGNFIFHAGWPNRRRPFDRVIFGVQIQSIWYANRASNLLDIAQSHRFVDVRHQFIQRGGRVVLVERSRVCSNRHCQFDVINQKFGVDGLDQKRVCVNDHRQNW